MLGKQAMWIPIVTLSLAIQLCIAIIGHLSGSPQAGYSFNSCGSSGTKGPTQFLCDSTYNQTGVQVKVIHDGTLTGVQVWTVSKTDIYSVIALGASGGTGVQNPEPSKGAYAYAHFSFTEGEEIYILIGQQGASACSQTNKINNMTKRICNHGTDEEAFIGGGGGGGGGTFVFKKVPNSTELIPLIIAGGGGGKSFYLEGNDVHSDGGLSLDDEGIGGTTWPSGPGGGGGWLGVSNYTQAGRSLLEGAIGGETCPKASSKYGWQISGGFGGGGGGCTAGGGGGGYTGGSVSRNDSSKCNGQDGSSYIHPDGEKTRLELGVNLWPDGQVEIAYVVDCPCEFMCIYKDYINKEYKCYCRPNFVLAEDGLHCIDPTVSPPETCEKLQTGAIVGIVIGCLVAVAIALYFGYCIAKGKRLPCIQKQDEAKNDQAYKGLVNYKSKDSMNS